jgi:hypothetical protein
MKFTLFDIVTMYIIYILIISLVMAMPMAKLSPKMRNGPPTSFPDHRLPLVSRESEHENSRLFEARAVHSFLPYTMDNVRVRGLWRPALVWSQLINCDSTNFFGISFISKYLADLRFELIDPNGQIIDLDQFMTNGSYPLNDDGTSSINTVNFQLPPVQGAYQLTVSSFETENHPVSLGVAIVYNDSPIEIFSHLTSYELDVGKPVGLVARVSNTPTENLIGVVDQAEMAIIDPDGFEHWIPMHDDGLHNDGVANDGVYGATFVPTKSGNYVWRAELSGQIAGVAFQRSTQHLVRVATVDAILSGTGTLSVEANRVTVAIDVKIPSDALLSEFHTYAELWTTTGIPIGWAMATTEVIENQVKLSWDARWLARAGVTDSLLFELRNVYISELNGFVPMSTALSIALTSGNLSELVIKDPYVDDDLLFFGPRPHWIDDAIATIAATATTTATNTTAAAATPTEVVLVHGYCSTTNPFVGKGHDWRLAHVFEDYDQNLPNDEFARRLHAFADSKGLMAWSGIGHSQGGIALVHLRSTYWSGLDVAAAISAAAVAETTPKKRLIQTVGTPWKGCSAAGTSANLIKAFGVACGANADLTPDGAALWLATVSEHAAKDVYYYPTVNFKNPGFFDSSCNWATNLVLDSPNDGTTELIRSDLRGGTNCGVTERQCHTEGMNYMAQTSDMQRNAVMDSYAM